MHKNRRLFSGSNYIIVLFFLVMISFTAFAQSKTITRYIEKHSALADSLSSEFEIPVSVILGVAIV